MQDNVDEVPIHGTDIDPIPTLEYSPKVSPEDNNDLTMVVSIKNIHAEELALNSSDDYEKMSTSRRKMQSSINHLSGKTLHNNVTREMAQRGPMRVLSRKDGKGTVSDKIGNEKVELTKLLEFIPARKPEQAKIGEVVRFMHNPGNGRLWQKSPGSRGIDSW